MSSLQEERSQLIKEKERVAQDGEQMRRELLEQQKCLARERQAYIVRQRLNPEGKEWISMEHITVFIVLFRKLSFMQKLPVDLIVSSKKSRVNFFAIFLKKLPLKKKNVIIIIFYLIFNTSVYNSINIPVSHGDNSCSVCSKCCGHPSSKWYISPPTDCLGKYGDIGRVVGGGLSVDVGSDAGGGAAAAGGGVAAAGGGS